MYYLFIDNGKINGGSDLLQEDVWTETYFQIEVSEELYNDYLANRDKYVYLNGEIIINPEWSLIQLQKVKDIKIEENDIARDSALIAGVLYKGVLFDSDTDQKVNLLATVSSMPEEITVVWFGMDNTPLVCTKEDLINIGGLITQLHTFCWTKNAEIKAQINYATTIEEVEAIEIDYTEGE